MKISYRRITRPPWFNDRDKFSIVNHFIHFNGTEAGSPDRFESDFMARHITGKSFYPLQKTRVGSILPQ
ncbi:MAG: hypothetical protein NTW16_02415 [Bacteroidetes bacterium]|nr:hypothetical protein [Bacteroidota bacterium]